jgi:integrase/recombinase XerD
MHVAAAKRFIRWAREEAEDIACPDFVRRFKGPAVQRSQPRSFSREQLNTLLERCQGQPLEVPVALAGLAGLRHAEFQRVQASDLNWKAKTLLVRAEKAHKDRVVPVTKNLAAILRRHPSASGPLVRANKGVRNLHRALHGLCTRAGVPRLGWHALRHTCASLMVSDGARLPAIRDMLGHANLSTTSIYVHSTDAEVREAAGKVLG